jgi:hypothetical protein
MLTVVLFKKGKIYYSEVYQLAQFSKNFLSSSTSMQKLQSAGRKRG